MQAAGIYSSFALKISFLISVIKKTQFNLTQEHGTAKLFWQPNEPVMFLKFMNLYSLKYALFS